MVADVNETVRDLDRRYEELSAEFVERYRAWSRLHAAE